MIRLPSRVDRGLDGVADRDDATVRTRNRALDEQHVALGVGVDDFEVERGDLLVAHVSGHALALEHTAGEGAGADRAGHAVRTVNTVAFAHAPEVVALHDTGETLASAGAGHVDPSAGSDRLDGDLLAEFETVDRIEPQFDEPFAGLDTSLLEVAGVRLVELLGVSVPIGHLQRGVSVSLVGLDLDDTHGFDTDHRDGNDLVVHPLLRHPDLLAENHCLCHCGCSLLLIEPNGLSTAEY